MCKYLENMSIDVAAVFYSLNVFSVGFLCYVILQ